MKKPITAPSAAHHRRNVNRFLLLSVLCLTSQIPPSDAHFVGSYSISIPQQLNHNCVNSTENICETFNQYAVLKNDTGFAPGDAVFLILGGQV